MFTIQPFTSFDPLQLTDLLSGGYTSAEKYAVERQELDISAAIRLRLVRLEQPYRKQFAVLPEDLERYGAIVPQGFSFAARAGEALAGAAIAEPVRWNNTLWIWEFHIAPAWQGRGAGRALMESVAERARQAGLRALVCETQTTNLPAIRFYRKLGFRLHGIDLSYYTNHDYPDGEMAVFMKREV